MLYSFVFAMCEPIGEVSEWSKVLDSKSSVVMSRRGFESHPLCQNAQSPGITRGTFLWLFS